MSTAREQIVRGIFDRFNEGSREIDPAELTDDIVVHSAMTGNEFRGPEAVRLWLLEIEDHFDRWTIESGELLSVEPDRVLALGTVGYRGRASGLETEQPIGYLFRFQGDRVNELRTFTSHEAARAAAGV